MMVDILVSVLQSTLFIVFIYCIFEKKCKNPKHILLMGVFWAFLSFSLCVLSVMKLKDTIYDAIICVGIVEVYTCLLYKGKLFVRIIMPIVTYFTNRVICFGFAYMTSIVTDISLDDILGRKGIVGYLCLVLVYLANVFVYVILAQITPKNFKRLKEMNAMSIVLLPLISIIIICGTFYILLFTGVKKDIEIIFIIVCISMIVVNIISNINEINNNYIYMKQKGELYEEDIIKTNDQIERIIQIKHDIINNISCIKELLEEGKTQEALKYCRVISDEINRTISPINTNNPLLNAVVNVMQEKALERNISMRTIILDEIMDYHNNKDLVSIVCNMCDNAIEYLEERDILCKDILLRIERYHGYIFITCRNKIEDSVICNNPQMKSSKKEDSFHGRGSRIIKEIAEKNAGKVDYYEEENYFYVQVLLKGRDDGGDKNV